MELKIHESIRLCSLTLKNWAQYKDCTINFNLDDSKGNIPITYFIGENGAGKTRIFEAIRVCLFGDDDSSIIKDSNLTSDEVLFRLYPITEKSKIKHQLNSGNEITDQKVMRIILTFEVVTNNDLKQKYKVERAWFFSDFSCVENQQTISDDKTNLIELKSSTIKRFIEVKYQDSGDVTWRKLKTPNFIRKLNGWIPEPVRDFFFFDGEKLTSIMANPHKGKIKDQALMKSDWFPIEKRIIPTIYSITERFDNEKSITGQKDKNVKEADTKLKDLKAKIKTLNERKQKITDQISINENQIKEMDRDFREKYKVNIKGDSIDKEIENFNLVQQIESVEKEINLNYSNLGKILGDNIHKVYNFENLMISSLVHEIADDLVKKKEDGIIPTKLDKSTFDYLINRVKLLCDDCIEKMKGEQSNVIDEELNERAKVFLNQLIELQNKQPIIQQEIQEKVQQHKDLYEKQDDLLVGNPTTEINTDILGEYIKLREKIEEIKNENEELNKDLAQVKESLSLRNKDKKKWDNLYWNRKKSLGKVENSDLYHYVSDILFDLFTDIKTNLNDNISNYIKKMTSKTFLSLIAEPESYKEVLIDSEWRFGFITEEHPDIPIYDASKGQFHVIGLSFLHSISGLTKNDLPIIFDTPFGRLGRKPKINIGSTIVKLFKGTQVILFLTEEEANNMLQYIKGKNGYSIDNPKKFEAKIVPITNKDLLKIIQTAN